MSDVEFVSETGESVSETAPARWRALSPLRNRDYRLLIGTTALSMFATGMWTVVMVFQVIAIDDSPTALSAVATCFSGGLLAFALVGGVVADRVPKRSVIVAVVADRVPKRSVIIAVEGIDLLAVTAVSVPALTGTIRLWHMAVASALLGAGSAFFYPAYSAYLPSILPSDELLAANGLEGALRPARRGSGGTRPGARARTGTRPEEVR
ncbi:MFS transporter [Planomonospora corallina]|uniref:MFS transporter n=1 Tax=Planomonospora corallina TaxID=1806052 RepID=A0ABV8I678_9ACTN